MAAMNSEDDFRGKLAVEVRAWQREGLVSPEQGSAILARHDLHSTAGRAFRLGRVTTFVSIVGSVVLAIGVIIFFAAYWHTLPAWSRTVLVCASTATALAAGYWLRYRWAVMPRVGAGLFLVGAILFQAGLFLLADVYHLRVDDPILLLVGGAGILSLAYAVRFQPLLLFGLLDGLAWLGWTLGQHYPNPPESFGLPLVYVLAGVLVYSLGHLHAVRRDVRRFEAIYQGLGLITIFAPTYVLTYPSFWSAARDHHLASLHVPLWLTGAVLLAIVAAASLLVGRFQERLVRVEAGVFAAIALTVGLVAHEPGWSGGYALLYNLLFFGLAMLTCIRGYLEGEARYVNAGIVFLALWLITRYCDTFWPLLPQSAFFMGGGLVLLGVAGGLELLRRRLLSAMRLVAPSHGSEV